MCPAIVDAVIKKDSHALKDTFSTLRNNDNWSLVTYIDDLLPYMVMESNLKYGNFHLVKMALFLRRLAIEGYFSKSTERKIVQLLVSEMIRRPWENISTGSMVRPEQNDNPIQVSDLVEEIGEHNLHNAFYYARELMDNEPHQLLQNCLHLGAAFVPDSLGHSISCFFPVVEDMLLVDHPHTNTALLSLIAYLCRYDVSPDILQDVEKKKMVPDDYNDMLKRCSSGSGIVNLHHMITFYIFSAWEKAAYNPSNKAPFGIMLDWIQDKSADAEKETTFSKDYKGQLPQDYDSFADTFSLDDLDTTVAVMCKLVEESPGNAVDWFFRYYAQHYEPNKWDPHYFTSLYASLRLFMDERIADTTARRMALDQAVRYYADGVS